MPTALKALSINNMRIFRLMLCSLAALNIAWAYDGIPKLETFASYEDMQRYFNSRNHRSLRQLDNPTADTYINAYNEYNEQPAKKRSRRDSSGLRQLPNAPMLLKFEITDAVEPSDEIKEIIRQHRSREMQLNATASEGKPARVMPKPHHKSKSRRSQGRVKRASGGAPYQLQVQLIPFLLEDAREPDDQTKALIRRMRTLELEQLRTSTVPPPPTMPATPPPIKATRSVNFVKAPAVRPPLPKYAHFKKAKYLPPLKGKRVKRSAPQMFKFELADAAVPANYQMARMGQVFPAIENATAKMNAMADTKLDGNDQSNEESRRLFLYKEPPAATTKTKKSLNSLPHGVQKVITQMLKENQSGKAYLKYIPANQMDYHQLKAAAYGTKLYAPKMIPSSMVKYMQPQQKVEQVQVQIHPVPVVEKVRYIYTPVVGEPEQQVAHSAQLAESYALHNYAGHADAATMSQPIVVHEMPPQSQSQPIEVHHTYTADLTQEHHFRPSKPDPLLYENKLNEATAESTPVEHYKYEVYAPPPSKSYSGAYGKYSAGEPSDPLIKIEYHAPADAIKENYKELDEFKQLSSLIGKSTDDQIHGLTYLVAKEMQNKLQLQRQQANEKRTQRAHSNTAPILFHPEQAQRPNQPQPQPQTQASNHGGLGVRAGPLIGMAKSKEYIPIVEQQPAPAIEEKPLPPAQPEQAVPVVKQYNGLKMAPQAPAPNSFIEYGLSANYDGAKGQGSKTHLLVGQVIHHPTVTHHGGVSEAIVGDKGKGGELSERAGAVSHSTSYGVHQGDELQYASKYAFGYRIRDFHTGNDFGHKQNRDMDGVTRGQYHILLPDGRIQNVIYHADDTGFHADVSFETGH